ncbi:SusC/RagA family TonB-linked outer membrane protein [Pedobacter frigoris]|nr:SusC/RagA family TonB-linked outer membrane protein [Pedobacter frigoris]
MKLTFLMVMIACLNVSAKVFSQEKLSFDMKNMELSRALKLIEKQSSFRFVYSPTEGPFNKQISVKVNKAPITDILDQLLEGTSLVYAIEGDNLVTISSKGKLLKDITVTGIVTDAAGLPLPGVSVSVKGVKGLGAMTDGTGKFSLKVPDNAILVFSFVSYETQEVAAVAGSTMRIQLKESNNNLDEIVVQAYGTTTKRKTTSAISTLDMKNVAPLPVQSINDAVAGRLAGIIVTTTSGAPGTKSVISIRGGGTPLFVIDNIIRSSNDFSNLNPNDIQDYSVLKDAAATALYGVAAANGVIVVTTKKGTEGSTNINYSYNQIFSQPTLFPTKVSSYEQLKAINDVYVAEGIQPPTKPEDLEGFRLGTDLIKYPNTDWRKVGMKDFAPEMRHDLSLSSGGKVTKYYASVSYYDQGTILRTDKNFNRRTTYRLNTTSNFDNLNLTVTTNLDGFVENNSQPGVSYGNLYSHIQNKQPRQQAYNEFGLPSNNTVDNPAVELHPQSGYIRNLSRVFNGNLGVEYAAHFLEGLKFKFNGVYNMYNSIGKSWNALAPSYANGSTTPIYANPPSLTSSSGEGKSITLQGYVTYNKTFGDHSVDFLGVYEQQQFYSSSLSGQRTAYQILFDQLLAGPTLNQSVGGSEGESARSAYLGRLNYTYKSKYSAELSVRRDGSDLFVPGKQWGTFYAVSAGYSISEENFMKGLKDKHIFDYLKFRGSYGVTGNSDGVGRFLYIPGYGISSVGWVIDGKAVQGTSEPGSLPSVNYSWQTIKSRNFGFDFASLDNHLNGSAEYYYTRTTGFVVGDPKFSQTLGIGLPPINFAEGANRKEGYEFNLSWNNSVGKLNYKVGLNFTRFNTLTERNTEDQATLQNPFTRGSGVANDFLRTGYYNAGFYTDYSQLLSGARIINANNVTAGDLRYQDTNGDGQINGSDNRRIGTNTMPRSNYGITVDLDYKGFFFTTVIQGAGNRDRYIGDVVQGASGQTLLTYDFQTDYWRPDNTDALFPRQVSTPSVNGSQNYQISDFWLIQSKYLRLKYLQLGYDFKHSLLKKSAFQQLRVFASGTNLLTSAKSQKYFIDPESETNNYGYPVQRTISFGISAGF